MLNRLNKSNYTLWLSLLGVVIIIIIVAVAIIDYTAHPSQSVITSSPVAGPASLKTGNMIGYIAPDFNLPTIENKMMSLYEYRGKNVILNFWATWCGPCAYEIPFLRETGETWSKAGVVIIAVNTQDNEQDASLYARRNNLNFIIPVDPRGKVAALYNVRGLPTSFFIDSEGVIKSIKVGPFISAGEIEERMKAFK